MASRFIRKGVQVYAIGVGRAFRSELRSIAYKKKHVYYMKTFGSLLARANQIAGAICSEQVRLVNSVTRSLFKKCFKTFEQIASVCLTACKHCLGQDKLLANLEEQLLHIWSTIKLPWQCKAAKLQLLVKNKVKGKLFPVDSTISTLTVATKFFGTSHRIDWEYDIQTRVTMDPIPKTIELCANKIQWN